MLAFCTSSSAVVACVGYDRGAEREVDVDPDSLDVVRLADPAIDAVAQVVDVRRAGQHHAEPVGLDQRHRELAGDQLATSLTDPRQQLLAELRAERVLDVEQVVELDDQHRRRAAVRDVGEAFVHALRQPTIGEEPGPRIVVVEPGQVSHLPAKHSGTQPNQHPDHAEEEQPLEPVRQVLSLSGVGVEGHERTDRHAGGDRDEQRAADLEDQRGHDHRHVHRMDGRVLHAAGELDEQPRQHQRDSRGGGRRTPGPRRRSREPREAAGKSGRGEL